MNVLRLKSIIWGDQVPRSHRRFRTDYENDCLLPVRFFTKNDG